MNTRVGASLHFDAVQAAKGVLKKETNRDRQRRERIEHIIGVAVEVFAREGMANFSMRRIASLAGITLSTLQHYFGSQKSLLVTTINSIGIHYMGLLDSLSKDVSITARERFDNIVDKIIIWSLDPLLSAAYFELFALSCRDETISGLMDEVYATFYGVLINVVAEINPELTDEQAKIIGILIGTQADGLAIFARHGVSTKLPATEMGSAMKAGWLKLVIPPEPASAGPKSVRGTGRKG